MLKSPIRLSQSNRCIDVDPVTGSTVVAGLPATDHVKKRIDFDSGARSGDQLDFGEDHGFTEDQPITFTTSNTPPAPLVANTTYYAKVIDAQTIEVRAVPGATEITLTDGGTGSHQCQGREFARSVMLCVYAGATVVRLCQDDTYTISDTTIEMFVGLDLAHPYILNVMGNKCLATRAVGSNADLCIIPLENA